MYGYHNAHDEAEGPIGMPQVVRFPLDYRSSVLILEVLSRGGSAAHQMALYVGGAHTVQMEKMSVW